MTFRRRNYAEVLDNLLTGIVGGVTAEAHAFPPANASASPDSHPLEKTPAHSIVSVHGARNGQTTLFTQDTDYTLSEDGQNLLWLEGASLPDKGSIFLINYLQGNTSGSLTDLYVGSVTRTVAESVGLEISRLYAQLEAVYRAGFIDTASGKSLENVVALLGVKRVQAGRFTCELEFSRANGSRGLIYIPINTRVMTQDGNVEYETTSAVTLQDGQTIAKVNARDVEENSQGLDADTLTIMAKPIAGIRAVTNPAPSAISDGDESDTELVARAKNFLHGSEKATLGAIKESVLRQGVSADVIESTDALGQKVGFVEVTPHADKLSPEMIQRINSALIDASPAGVNVNLLSSVAPENINLKLRLSTSSSLLEDDLRAIQVQVREKVRDYFEILPVNESGSTNKLIGLVLSIAEIDDMEILDMRDTNGDELPFSSGQLGIQGKTTVLNELEIIDPNLPTRLQVVVRYPDHVDPPDEPTINTALNTFLAAVNSANSEEREDPIVLNFESLLFLLPLPDSLGKTQGEFAEILANTAVLPNSGVVQPYLCEFIFTQDTGLSFVIANDGENYTFNPFERLSIGQVELTIEN